MACDLHQNIPNVYNRYKSAERKIPQKNLEYILNYSFHVAAVEI
jgi:hypothetical protein